MFVLLEVRGGEVPKGREGSLEEGNCSWAPKGWEEVSVEGETGESISKGMKCGPYLRNSTGQGQSRGEALPLPSGGVQYHVSAFW